MNWISVEAGLPRMFKNVLVYGCCDSYLLGCYQVYQVRRFSGWNSPYDEENWSWLNTRDELVSLVTHWMELPKEPEKPAYEHITDYKYCPDCGVKL